MSRTLKIAIGILLAILVVGGLAIVGVFALVLAGFWVAVDQVGDQTKVSTTRMQILSVNDRVLVHQVRTGKLPTTAEGLEAALGGEPLPLDAWGRPLLYLTPGPAGSPFDVISFGSDGVEGGEGAAADLRLSDLQ